MAGKFIFLSVNAFDAQITGLANHFCRKHELFDRIVVLLSDSNLLKGGVMVLLIWFIWFGVNHQGDQNRQKVISTLIGSFVAMFIARILPHATEFRIRPILNPDAHLVEAFGLNKANFDNASSFPSDHCTLFFALATGIFLVSRRLGLAAFLYVSLFIAFPRIYLGLHYFTDVLCGAAIGMASVFAANIASFRTNVSNRILSYSATHPGIFYVMFLFISYEIAEMFTGLRSIASFMLHPYTSYLM